MYKQIDPNEITTYPIADRKNFINIEATACDPYPETPDTDPLPSGTHALAQRISESRKNGASVMLAYGAHLIKNGGGPLVRALIDGDHITHIATQGAGIIHDWEFSYQGASSESVRDNAPVGKFGTWDETGRYLNLAIITGAAEGLGMGEAVGRLISEDGLTIPNVNEISEKIHADPDDDLNPARADLLNVIRKFDLAPGRIEVKHPFKKYSAVAYAYEKRVPFTVHPGIGYDIIATHPMYNGAAIGRAAGIDGRIFAQSVLNLSNGVYLSVGSAIMSPQVFEKAISIANNILKSRNQPFLTNHHIAIVDIQNDGNWDWSKGEPPKDHPAYYLRFCKSFHRMGGTTEYLLADNCAMLTGLLGMLRADA